MRSRSIQTMIQARSLPGDCETVSVSRGALSPSPSTSLPLPLVASVSRSKLSRDSTGASSPAPTSPLHSNRLTPVLRLARHSDSRKQSFKLRPTTRQSVQRGQERDRLRVYDGLKICFRQSSFCFLAKWGMWGDDRTSRRRAGGAQWANSLGPWACKANPLTATDFGQSGRNHRTPDRAEGRNSSKALSRAPAGRSLLPSYAIIHPPQSFTKVTSEPRTSYVSVRSEHCNPRHPARKEVRPHPLLRNSSTLAHASVKREDRILSPD